MSKETGGSSIREGAEIVGGDARNKSLSEKALREVEQPLSA
jgi:hypothetical protein